MLSQERIDKINTALYAFTKDHDAPNCVKKLHEIFEYDKVCTLLSYVYPQEKQSYDECPCFERSNHIFTTIKELDKVYCPDI